MKLGIIKNIINPFPELIKYLNKVKYHERLRKRLRYIGLTHYYFMIK